MEDLFNKYDVDGDQMLSKQEDGILCMEKSPPSHRSTRSMRRPMEQKLSGALGQVLAFAKAEFQLTLSVEAGGPWRLCSAKEEGP